MDRPPGERPGGPCTSCRCQRHSLSPVCSACCQDHESPILSDPTQVSKMLLKCDSDVRAGPETKWRRPEAEEAQRVPSQGFTLSDSLYTWKPCTSEWLPSASPGTLCTPSRGQSQALAQRERAWLQPRHGSAGNPQPSAQLPVRCARLARVRQVRGRDSLARYSLTFLGFRPSPRGIWPSTDIGVALEQHLAYLRWIAENWRFMVLHQPS